MYDVLLPQNPPNSPPPPPPPTTVGKEKLVLWKLLIIICTKAKLYTNRIPEHKRGRGTKAMQQVDETNDNLCFKRVSTSPFVIFLAFDVSVAKM